MRSTVQPSKVDSPVGESQGSPVSEGTSFDSKIEVPVKTDGDTGTLRQMESQKNATPAQQTISLGMRNQMSSSRAMTVELNTLKDMTPKLMREVHTYTISECQHVKELEKNLPFCREHRDVRFSLVLEEIHRLRANRGQTLDKLRETHVKIAELEFRLELSSFQAGEIFWDQKLAQLAQASSVDLSSSSAPNSSKEFRPNFEYAPVTESIKTSAKDANTVGRYGLEALASNPQVVNQKVESGERGLMEYGDKVIIDATPSQGGKLESLKESMIESIESYRKEKQSSSGLETQSQATFDVTASSPKKTSDLGPILGAQQYRNSAPNSETTHQANALEEHAVGAAFPPTEIDELISNVEKAKRQSSKLQRKLLLFSAIPSAALVGLLILELETKVISNLFVHLAK